jgi:hypothetical protein
MLTNVRDTSLMAYKDINANGQVGTQKEQICSKMIVGVDYSLRELKDHIGTMEMSSICGRVNSLKKEGKLLEVEKRRCTISGRLITPVVLSTINSELEL